MSVEEKFQRFLDSVSGGTFYRVLCPEYLIQNLSGTGLVSPLYLKEPEFDLVIGDMYFSAGYELGMNEADSLLCDKLEIKTSLVVKILYRILGLSYGSKVSDILVSSGLLDVETCVVYVPLRSYWGKETENPDMLDHVEVENGRAVVKNGLAKGFVQLVQKPEGGYY